MKFLQALVIICLVSDHITGQGFSQLMQKVQNSVNDGKEAQIIEYISSQGGLPLVEGDTAIFMAKSPLSTPRISSGFNGFLSPRYITDPLAGLMTAIPGTSWYFLKRHLFPDARIFYQIVIDSIAFNDPLNPRVGFRFNLINSELRMPEFSIDQELVSDQFVPEGELVSLNIESEKLGHERTVHIYLPRDYKTNERSYPTVYFHDGSFYLDWGKVHQILDYLIHHQKIAPIIAVFDDPVDRAREYQGSKDYLDYMDQELIPFVDAHFRTLDDAQNRAAVGGSRGGQSSLILSHSTGRFAKCGVFAPAIHPTIMDDFLSSLQSKAHSPDEVVIIGAVYDHIWYSDSQALKAYFENNNTKFHYQDISAGHNLQSWVTWLDTVLEFLFPVTENQ